LLWRRSKSLTWVGTCLGLKHIKCVSPVNERLPKKIPDSVVLNPMCPGRRPKGWERHLPAGFCPSDGWEPPTTFMVQNEL